VRVLKNIMIALGLLALSVLVGGVINASNPPAPGSGGAISTVVWLMVIGTSVWAAVSAKRLEFRKYRSGLASGPTAVFLVNVLLWIVAFPWFLTVRDKIKEGSAELKDEFKHEAIPPVAAPSFQRMPSPVVPPPIPVAQPVPSPLPRPQASVDDRFEQLRKLGQLKDQGILTDQEFQAEKQKLLGQA
jgi:hypothetical protein